MQRWLPRWLVALARNAANQATRRSQRTTHRRYGCCHQATARAAWTRGTSTLRGRADLGPFTGAAAGGLGRGHDPGQGACGAPGAYRLCPCGCGCGGPTPCRHGPRPHRRLGQGAQAPATTPYGPGRISCASAIPRLRAGRVARGPRPTSVAARAAPHAATPRRPPPGERIRGRR